MTADEQRTIGRLEAEIEIMKDQNKQMMSDLRDIRDTLASAKGGWKTLLAVAGVASATGAIAAKIAPFLGMLPK